MTPKQKQQFNKMRYALLVISKEYRAPRQLRRESERAYGLDFEEALEMAYENIQDTARLAVKGVKEIV